MPDGRQPAKLVCWENCSSNLVFAPTDLSPILIQESLKISKSKRRTHLGGEISWSTCKQWQIKCLINPLKCVSREETFLIIGRAEKTCKRTGHEEQSPYIKAVRNTESAMYVCIMALSVFFFHLKRQKKKKKNLLLSVVVTLNPQLLYWLATGTLKRLN